MNTLVHSLNIGHDSWHARWYRHWQNLGGKPSPYRENLCRYVRILLIYAPLRWFFKGRISKYVPPWVATLIASFLAFVGVAFYLWPDAALEVLWKMAAVTGGIALGSGLVIGVAYLYDRDPRTTQKVAKWTTLPFWGIPYLLFLGGRWIWDTFEDQLRALGQFIQRRIFFGIDPFVVVMALGAMGFAALAFYNNPIKAAIVVGSIFFASCVIVGIVVLVENRKERRQADTQPSRPRTRVSRTYEGVADTVKLGATYIATKKKGSRICPFINFEHSPT